MRLVRWDISPLTDHGTIALTVFFTQQAKAALETARNQVADFIGCNSDEITFTSGGSESANYALRGLCGL
jgi:cysteine desulfurase